MLDESKLSHDLKSIEYSQECIAEIASDIVSDVKAEGHPGAKQFHITGEHT